MLTIHANYPLELTSSASAAEGVCFFRGAETFVRGAETFGFRGGIMYDFSILLFPTKFRLLFIHIHIFILSSLFPAASSYLCLSILSISSYNSLSDISKSSYAICSSVKLLYLAYHIHLWCLKIGVRMVLLLLECCQLS